MLSTSPQASPAVNRLIAGQPRKERDRIPERAEPVELVFADSLCEPGDVFRYVCFSTTSFFSLVATVSSHPPLEMGLIGNEGMLGATLQMQMQKMQIVRISHRLAERPEYRFAPLVAAE